MKIVVFRLLITLEVRNFANASRSSLHFLTNFHESLNCWCGRIDWKTYLSQNKCVAVQRGHWQVLLPARVEHNLAEMCCDWDYKFRHVALPFNAFNVHLHALIIPVIIPTSVTVVNNAINYITQQLPSPFFCILAGIFSVMLMCLTDLIIIFTDFNVLIIIFWLLNSLLNYLRKSKQKDDQNFKFYSFLILN